MKNLATGQIRLDHTHVMASFHRYKPDADAKTRQGLVDYICIALEMHAHLEEEIFYPALREAGIDSELIDTKSLPEHAEQHRLIERLRQMEADDPSFEQTFMDLMRVTIHHVADEETSLLPDAERRLSRDRLGEIGKRMTARRMQLTKEFGTDIAGSLSQAASPAAKLLAGGALLAGTFVVGRALSRGGSSHGATH